MSRPEAARAKINLFLHVTGRRPDGYHLLDSLAVFPGAADLLAAEPAEALSLEVAGPFAGGLGTDDNLVLRAARALGPGRGARLRLEKRLPVASGIGGGSADAAAALRLLARLWRLDPSPDELAALALSLGADVPVCLRAEPARMGGIGERIGAAPALPDCAIALVNPGLPVSTADIFRARDAAFSEPATLPSRWPDARAMATDLSRLRNDLEPPALRLCPAIADTLAALRAHPACLLARMSGSGATCFALFETEAEAHRAAAAAPAHHWSWSGKLAT